MIGVGTASRSAALEPSAAGIRFGSPVNSIAKRQQLEALSSADFLARHFRTHPLVITFDLKQFVNGQQLHRISL